MDAQEYFKEYKNHPVLFVGTGLSLRYLEQSYTWDGLLGKIAYDLCGNHEYYLDLKGKSVRASDGLVDYRLVADYLESDFNDRVKDDRNGSFKKVNDAYYEYAKNKGLYPSRFKIYVCDLLKSISYKDSMSEEIDLFKRSRKNISCVITTNYDGMMEDIFGFSPLVGNSILLSNPYGSVYKVHGCVSDPKKIILTTDDYNEFDEKYHLIRAQLLSLFIHNPIVFLGYSVNDSNIKNILKTIYSYVDANSEQARKIERNFLLVEYDKDSTSLEVTSHDIEMEGYKLIRINKISTDDYSGVYKLLANLTLPISAMDVRKVQDIVRDIMAGGSVKVTITDDLDALENSDKVLAIGSSANIKYEYKDQSSMIVDYFKTIEDQNHQVIELINKMKIIKDAWFPVFGFYRICSGIKNSEILKETQMRKLAKIETEVAKKCRKDHCSIQDILSDDGIAASYKINAIVYYCMNEKIATEDLREYLISYEDKRSSDYKKMLCAYDLVKYG